MCPTLVPTGALVCLRTLAPLGHIPVFRVYLIMGGGAVRGARVGRGGSNSRGTRPLSCPILQMYTEDRGSKGIIGGSKGQTIFACNFHDEP